MGVDVPWRPTTAATAAWVDDVTRSTLELLAAGVTELVGFDIAAISVLVQDQLEVVAVSGDDGARRALEGSRSALHLTEDLLLLAEHWGALRFIPGERASEYLSQHGWTPDYQRLDVDDAWDAEDMLIAPLHDDAGAIQGLLSVDLPSDGRRPGPHKRGQLERYAAQAGRAVRLAVERAGLAEQVALASRARLAVREAARDLSLDGLLEQCQHDLVAGFRARGIWIHLRGPEPAERGVIWERGPRDLDVVPPAVARVALRAAEAAFHQHRAAMVSSTADDGHWTPADAALVRDFMDANAMTTALIVPLSDGRACLGLLALTRGAEEPDWSDNDVAVALDVGHDLGHAVAQAGAFEREQGLVRELQALDEYKSELMATLSHELKTPLASILGNVELLREVDGIAPDGQRGLGAIERGTLRLSRVVDDLMLLAKIGDPGNPLISRPVDLSAIVDDVVSLTAATVTQRSLVVSVRTGAQPVLAWGDPDELDRVVTNLVSNATKYTEDGGRIELSVRRSGDNVVLSCTDDGIGISALDQQRLFREFFRSTNPRALGVPGTGLGLAIVERIVRRHGGRIGVRSGLGDGTCFEVSLPAADLGDHVVSVVAL